MHKKRTYCCAAYSFILKTTIIITLNNHVRCAIVSYLIIYSLMWKLSCEKFCIWFTLSNALLTGKSLQELTKLYHSYIRRKNGYIYWKRNPSDFQKFTTLPQRNCNPSTTSYLHPSNIYRRASAWKFPNLIQSADNISGVPSQQPCFLLMRNKHILY